MISIAENGFIVVWQLALDSRRCLGNIFGMKVKVMCMAMCPHTAYLAAFGLASGSIIIADLRSKCNNMNIINNS